MLKAGLQPPGPYSGPYITDGKIPGIQTSWDHEAFQQRDLSDTSIELFPHKVAALLILSLQKLGEPTTP